MGEEDRDREKGKEKGGGKLYPREEYINPSLSLPTSSSSFYAYRKLYQKILRQHEIPLCLISASLSFPYPYPSSFFYYYYYFFFYFIIIWRNIEEEEKDRNRGGRERKGEGNGEKKEDEDERISSCEIRKAKK